MTLSKIEDWLKGKKVHVLMFLGALVAISQYALGIDLQTTLLPVAHTPGELASELWAFAVGSGFRAAIAKVQ